MSDLRILCDSFNLYYDRGMDFLKSKNFKAAKRNILLASETILKLAKESSGMLREQRIRRAEELEELAKKIEEQEKSVPQNKKLVGKHEIKIDKVEKVNLNNALDSLLRLEGLHSVKEQVSDLVDQIKVFQMRQNEGLPTPEMSYHMVFTGNPGTGKTTVARIVGQIYCALGVLSKGHLVEVDRSDLVAGYVGQTAIKTKEVINQAKGGVLFIDEAYSLKKEGNDFGQEAIDTLNKAMEDERNDLVVIVAGYKDEIKTFIDSNQGLRSRFRTYIDFNDYTGEELYNIFTGIVEKNQYLITNEADRCVYNYLQDKDLNMFNGNARDVRNLFENIIKLQSRRIARLSVPSKSDIVTITKEDLPFKSINVDDLVIEPTVINPTIKSIYCPTKSNLNNNPLENKTLKDCLYKNKLNRKDIITSEANPEDEYLNLGSNNAFADYKFDWDSLPVINFNDIAGLESVKEVVRTKVLLPLEYPEAFEGYEKKNGGGLFLYGPPGTGKTMIAAAIANEIGAKFCSVKPSDLLHQGAGNTEKAVKALFAQARQFPCSVIYFDEMDSIAQKNTKSSYSRQLRSELLAQLQGIDAYSKDTGNLLFLIAATNKPWEVDSAFVRPGRFGTKIYVGLPDADARRYMIENRFDKIRSKGIVHISADIDIEEMVEKTNGFNCSDITNLLDRIDEISAIRGVITNNKYISLADVDEAFEDINSSVQSDDIEKLINWKEQNNG